MTAYVQDRKTFADWVDQVNGWIQKLSTEAGSAWSVSDSLQLQKDDSAVGLCTLNSRHQRNGELAEIELRHLWIRMN